MIFQYSHLINKQASPFIHFENILHSPKYFHVKKWKMDPIRNMIRWKFFVQPHCLFLPSCLLDRLVWLSIEYAYWLTEKNRGELMNWFNSLETDSINRTPWSNIWVNMSILVELFPIVGILKRGIWVSKYPLWFRPARGKLNSCVCLVGKCLEKSNKSKYIWMFIMETIYTTVDSAKKYLPITLLLR